MEVIGAPSREDKRTRRRELPTVWPYPASNGSAMNLVYVSAALASSLVRLFGISKRPKRPGICTYLIFVGFPPDACGCRPNGRNPRTNGDFSCAHTPPFRPARRSRWRCRDCRLYPTEVKFQQMYEKRHGIYAGANERLDLFASPGKLLRHILNVGNLRSG